MPLSLGIEIGLEIMVKVELETKIDKSLGYKGPKKAKTSKRKTSITFGVRNAT